MKGVIEIRGICVDLLVTPSATLVRDRFDTFSGELRVALHVGDDFLKRDELVHQASDHARIDVALDAGDVLVWSLCPCVVVRTHLVAHATESRLIGRSGHPEQRHAEDDDRQHTPGDEGAPR